MWWTLGVLIAVLAIAGIALQIAIARNGPAVLSAVDRIAGEAEGVQLKTTLLSGEDERQRIHVWGTGGDTAPEPRPVLLFLHGGSWRSGDPVDYGFVGRAFVPKGFVVALASYRLHPKAVYPAMLEDTAAAIARVRREIHVHGGDPDRIILAGHSAGAYNVVMAALEERWLAQEGLSAANIAGVVGLAGPYDFYPFDSESTIDSFGHAADPEATQPINHVRADAPPMLLIHGEQDTLVRPRNTRALAERIEAAGGSVETRFYPTMEHNDPLISLAAPWRSSRDVDDVIADFARGLPHRGIAKSTGEAKPSVPVQGETR